MLTLRRGILVLGGMLLSLCALSGCEDKSKSNDDQDTQALPFAETSLVIHVPKSADDSERWTVLLSEWMARSGATCEVRPYDDSAGFEASQKVWNEIECDGSIVLFPRLWMAEMCQGKHLSPIPEDLHSIEELNWPDIHPKLADACYRWEKSPIVLPIREPLLVLYYRSDLLEQAGLRPPESWEDYRELISTIDKWAPGMTAVEPWGKSFRTNMFLARSVEYVKTPGNYSVFLNYNTGEPLIGTPGFVRGLQESLDAQQWLDPRVQEFSPDDCLAELASGRSAIGIASAFPDVGRALPDAANRNVRWAAVPLPAATQIFEPGRQEWKDPSEGALNRVTLTGWEGLMAGVLSRGTESSRRACWNLLQTLMVETGPDAFTAGRMTATRLSISRQASLPGLKGLDARQFTDAVTKSFREAEVVPVLVMSKREPYLEALDDAVNRVLAGESDPQTALEELAKQWRERLDATGKQKQLDSYKGGLGVRIHN